MSRADAGQLEVGAGTELSPGNGAVLIGGDCAVAHSLCPSTCGGATRLQAEALRVEARFEGDGAGRTMLWQSQAAWALHDALHYFNGKNLDEMTALGAAGTVHERMARTLWTRIVHNLAGPVYDRLDKLDVSVRVSDDSSVVFQRRLPGRAQDDSPRAGRVTAIVLDLDHLGDDIASEGARESGPGCGDADVGITPTGIEHCSSFAKLLSAVPIDIFALTSLPASKVRAHLDAHGLGSIEFAKLLPRDTDKETGDPDFWEGIASKTGRLDEPPSILLASASERVRQDASAARVGPSEQHISVACPTDQGLLAGLGCKRGGAPDPVAYLTAKRPTDAAAYNQDTLRRLEAELAALRDGGTLRVLDLGAGTLSMLPAVVGVASRAGWTSLAYVAVESDARLVDAAALELQTSRGYRVDAPTDAREDADPTKRLVGAGPNGMEVHLTLITADAFSFVQSGAPPHLLVACAFADLVPPELLLTRFRRLAPGALVYLPITFTGSTVLDPASAGDGNVPPDARVTEIYHEFLRQQGQHIDAEPLVAAVGASGAELLAKGDSPWVIGSTDALHPYMVDFLAAGTAASLWREGWDPAAWRASTLRRGPTIRVANMDVLLRAPAAAVPRKRGYPGLEFAAARKVRIVKRDSPAILSDGEAELRGIVSMVSSGTELLVYRGDFDVSDEPLDATIKGLKDESMAYPMPYGYSFVGEVVAIGEGVPLGWLGKKAFAFAPHAAAAFTSASSMLEVPDDLSASDGAFLPAAETAISLVHDAHPRAGEAVAVFGVGVIGLLVIAALSRMGLRAVAVDPIHDRLALARRLGASTAVTPAAAPQQSVDVAIECSGNPRALQGAIDATRDGGTVVVASWYGRKPISLSLGTRFHRSHMRLVASQVSLIPGEISATWSKQRRFDAAWDLIRHVRPSSSLLSETMPLARAADAYQMLDEGKGVVYHLSLQDAD